MRRSCPNVPTRDVCPLAYFLQSFRAHIGALICYNLECRGDPVWSPCNARDLANPGRPHRVAPTRSHLGPVTLCLRLPPGAGSVCQTSLLLALPLLLRGQEHQGPKKTVHSTPRQSLEPELRLARFRLLQSDCRRQPTCALTG